MRQTTNQIQVIVASVAMSKVSHSKLGSKPGKRRLTFAAGCDGQPVCIAIQMTQMMKAQPEKKMRVNQSIKAATLRRRVGKAKAASVASAGSANKRVCSADCVSKAVLTVSAVNHMGKTK